MNGEERAYICMECGWAFNDPEVTRVGDELCDCCPHCGSYNVVDAQFCTCCKSNFPDDGVGELCGTCREELAHGGIDNCLAISRELEPEDVPITPALARMFTPYQIEEILRDVLLKQQEFLPTDMTPFINACEEEIADFFRNHEQTGND